MLPGPRSKNESPPLSNDQSLREFENPTASNSPISTGAERGTGASGGQASGLVVTAALFARSLVNSLPLWLCGATEAGNNVAQTSPLGDTQ